MITQYSHQQITLSDREKEYAWFHYAAQIINAGCMDQSLSGYSITGTGSDGKTVSAELTNEELFQIFSEVTTKYGKELIKARMQEESQMEQSMLQEDVQPDPLERKDFQIQIVRHELKTRKADVSIAWGNNIKVEGISINSRSRGGVRLVQPTLFGTDGQRTQLIHVGDALQNAILDAYNKMPEEQEMLRTVYIAKQTGFFVRTIPVQEGKVVLVYKCRQKKLNSLYYKKKEQRRCSTWRKIKNRILRNSSSRSSISTMPEVPHILNWNMNMA